MLQANMGNTGVMRRLNVLLREIENLPWDRRQIVSNRIVERVLRFSQEFMQQDELRQAQREHHWESIKARSGIGSRKGPRSAATRARRPSVRAPVK